MVERVVVGAWKTNCYIFSSAKKECIIIDPGGDEVEIASRVDVLNMVPVGIALTHGHVDHVAALAKLQENYARRGYTLPVAINQADRRFLGTGGMETHRESLEVLGLDQDSFFGVDPSELPKADVRLKEGDRVFSMDLVVIETPGHTPGGVCFYAEKEGVLFSGDTLFFDGVGRTDLPGGSDKKLRESIQKKIAVLPPETRVFPGHGPFTTVEREKRGNPFFKVPLAPAPAAPVPLAGRPSLPGLRTTLPVSRPVEVPRPPAAKKVVKARKAAAKPVAKKSAAPKKGAVAKKSAAPKKPAAKAARPAAPARRRAQATRSTKAPGKGKKPAR
jgi:hydroxyacylglutathione hydrolase